MDDRTRHSSDTMIRRPRASVSPASWDAVVRSSPDGWVWALTAWLDMIEQVPRWALSDQSFAIEHDARIVAVVPLHYIAAGRRLASSGWGWVGPVLAGGLHPRFETKILQSVYAEIRSVAAKLGVDRVEIATPAVTSRSLTNTWGVSPFAAYGFADVSTISRVVNLERSEEELWHDLSEMARRAIKRALRLGYGVEVAEWGDFLEEYYRAHCETYERTGVAPHPREYFEGIALRIAPMGHAMLRVGRAPDGRAVAFHNTARFGDSALYHTGCSETGHMDSGVNHLLFWSSIVDSKTAGCRWYEVGEIFPGIREGKMYGLTRLKTSFGGQDHRYFRGVLQLAEATLPAESESTARSRAEAVTRASAASRVAAFLSTHLKGPASRLRNGAVGTTTHAAISPSRATTDVTKNIRAAYEKGDLYATDRICAKVNEQSREYTDRLLATKLALVRRHYPGGLAVDLCCATGGHLMALADHVERGIGIDFAARYVQRGQVDATAGGHHHLSFVCADAKRLPLPENCAGLLYSLSSLYAIPGVGEVLAEINRVLRPGGVAVLDLGNSRSLNTYCLRVGYKHWPTTFPISVSQMRQLCAENKLDVLEHRSFQLLPLWAGKPDWLWPLLHPGWRRILQRRVGGRMLDEWVSSLPVLRMFSFRHLLVCRKSAVA